MKKIVSIIFILAVFSACKKSQTASSSPSNNSNTSFTAWNPPLGESVPGGIVLAEGWSTPKLVASPVNYAQNGGWSDSVSVSRDGLTLYFGYTPVDYFIFESTQVM